MSAEPDYLPADALAEDEPKYLRRQKPVEIRKRKFSRKAWPLYRRVLAGAVAAIVAGLVLYQAGNYFLFSPGVILGAPIRFPSRETVSCRAMPLSRNFQRTWAAALSACPS